MRRISLGIVLHLLLVSGPAWSQGWEDLRSEARELKIEKMADSALAVMRLAYAAFLEDSSGAADTSHGMLLFEMARMLQHQDQFDSAVIQYERCVEVVSEILGQHDPYLSRPFNGLGRIYYLRRHLDTAISFYGQARDILLRADLQGDHRLATAFTGMGNAFRRTRQFDSSQTYYRMSIACYKVGPDSLHYLMASPLNSLGIMYKNLRFLDSAQVTLERALEIQTTAKGEDDSFRASILSNLGNVHARQGHIIEAEDCHLESLRIWLHTDGEISRGTQGTRFNLAQLYNATGRYEQAVDMLSNYAYVDSLIYGADSRRLYITYINVGFTFTRAGEYALAEEAMLAAHRTWTLITGEGNQLFPVHLNNLVTLYNMLGRYEESLLWSDRNLAHLDEFPAKDSLELVDAMLVRVHVLTSLNSREAAAKLYRSTEALAMTVFDRHPEELYSNQGVFKDLFWAPIYLGDTTAAERVLANLERALINRPTAVLELSLLAMRSQLMAAKGLYAQAVPLFEECYNNLHSYGPRSRPSLVLQLGVCKALSGQLNDGLGHIREALDLETQYIGASAYGMAATDAYRLSRRLRENIDACLGVMAQMGPGDLSNEEVAALLISYKGTYSDAIAQKRRLTLIEPTLSRKSRELQTTSYALFSSYSSLTAAKNTDSAAHHIDSLKRHIKLLEAETFTHSPEEAKQYSPSDVMSGVLESLPEGTCLVDYIRSDSSGYTSTPAQYWASVVHADGRAATVLLARADQIDRLVSDYTNHMNSVLERGGFAPSRADDEYTKLAQNLYRLVWQPLEIHLAQSTNVFVAPDASLHRLSFGTLMDESGRYLVEDYALSYLTSARDLIAAEPRGEQGTGLLGLGHAQFDASPDARLAALTAESTDALPVESATSTNRGGCDDLSDMVLSELPLSERELRTIAKTWSERFDEPAELGLREGASEERFKLRAPGSRVIHIATHGFSTSGACASDYRGTGWLPSQQTAAFDPMLQSGLCLAGATYHGPETAVPGAEDGFLTSQEIAYLPLEGAELVVLSACETGLGHIEASEGVIGLRRAFLLSGARSVISSLWRVDDAETSFLMSRLYEQDALSLAHRLQLAQLSRLNTLRGQGESDHPVSWGAWVAVGASP